LSARAFQTIWSWVALIVLLFTVLGFLRVSGVDAGGAGTPLEPFGVFAFKTSEVSTFLLPLQIMLVALLLKLTAVWTGELGEACWATRLPVFFFKHSEVHPHHPGGQRFQLIAVIALIWAPMAVSVFFVTTYLRATVYFSPKGDQPTYSTGISGLHHFDTASIYASAHGQPGFWRLGTESGPEYFPVLIWVYAVLLVALLAYFVRVAIWGLHLRRKVGVTRFIIGAAEYRK
jgi:hypothetical protein